MEITNLNYDVLLNILSFMDDKSKLFFISTCKQYRYLLNNVEFNESYYLENIKHLSYLNNFTNIIIKLHVDLEKFIRRQHYHHDIDVQFTKLFTDIDCDLLPNNLKILHVERNEHPTVKLTRNIIKLTDDEDKVDKYFGNINNIKNTPKIRAKRNNSKGYIPYIYSLSPINEVKINGYLYTIDILYDNIDSKNLRNMKRLCSDDINRFRDLFSKILFLDDID